MNRAEVTGWHTTTERKGMAKMKTKIAFIMALAIFSAAALAANGDLQVRSVEYSQITNRLVATIYNQAPVAVHGPILVYFYDGQQKIGDVVYNEDIPRYSIVSVYINYIPPEGGHHFTAVVDPLNTINETTEGNNQNSLDLNYSLNGSSVAIAPSIANAPPTKQQGTETPALGIYVGAIILIAAIAAIIWTLKSGKKRQKARNPEPTTRRKEEPAAPAKSEAHKDRLMKIRDIAGMPKGTNVKFRAHLSYHDKIGREYAYFLKDETEEIIGFSKHEIHAKEGIISGTMGHFLGENTAVMIEKIE